MGIIIKILDEFQLDYGLAMDFLNDNTTSVTQKNEKCGLKKYVKIVSKLKF